MAKSKTNKKKIFRSMAEIKRTYFPKAYEEESSERNKGIESRIGSGFSKELARILKQEKQKSG